MNIYFYDKQHQPLSTVMKAAAQYRGWETDDFSLFAECLPMKNEASGYFMISGF